MATDVIEIDDLATDVADVIDHVVRDKVRVTVVRGDQPVAVILPVVVDASAPMAAPVADERAPADAFFLDAIETRRLLGL